METRSKIFAIFLILCILTCISAVSASDVNDTQLGESQQTVEVTQSPDLDDN